MRKSLAVTPMSAILSRILIAFLFIAIGACAPDHNRRERKTRVKPQSVQQNGGSNNANNKTKTDKTRIGHGTDTDNSGGTDVPARTDTSSAKVDSQIVDPATANPAATKDEAARVEALKIEAARVGPAGAKTEDNAANKAKNTEADAKADGGKLLADSQEDAADSKTTELPTTPAAPAAPAVPADENEAAAPAEEEAAHNVGTACKIYDAANLAAEEKTLPYCGSFVATTSANGDFKNEVALGTSDDLQARTFTQGAKQADPKNPKNITVSEIFGPAPREVGEDSKEEIVYTQFIVPNKASEIAGSVEHPDEPVIKGGLLDDNQQPLAGIGELVIAPPRVDDPETIYVRIPNPEKLNSLKFRVRIIYTLK